MADELRLRLAEASSIAPVPTASAMVRYVPHGEPAPVPPSDWQRHLAAVRRFKWLVLGVTLVAATLGAAAALRMPPTYLARATVWVQVPSTPTREEGPIWSGQLPISSGWKDLLQSNAVLEDVVRSLRLYLAPRLPTDSDALATFGIQQRVRGGTFRLATDSAGQRFTLFDGKQHALQEGAAGDSVGGALGFAWLPPPSAFAAGRRVEFTVTTPGEAALQLGKDLKLSADVDGNFLRLELGGHEPALVAATVNAVAERFVATAASLKRGKLTELTRILSGQLTRAQANLQQAEAALRGFRVDAVTVFAENAGPVTRNMQYPNDPVFAGLLDMKVSREQLRYDRQAIERVLTHAGDSRLAVDALAMIGAVQRSTELAQALRDLTTKQADLRALRARYTDEHPPVRRLAAEVATLERQTIPALATSLAAEMKVREGELARGVDSAAGSLRKIPPLAVEEARLQRELSFAEQTVANLQQRYNEAHLAEVSSIPDVRVLDRADAPQQPVGHVGALLVFASLLGGLGLGVLGAVVLDRSDHRVHYPDHVTQAMGLTILGAIPHVARGEEGIAPVIEAVRAIRLNVAQLYGTNGPVVVTITSPGRADGKSFVASNLALAFADAGCRTLLIDADVRRGGLHHVLNVSRSPGLTECLAGSAPRSRVIQATSYPALSFIGCGGRSNAGPSLLSSAAMPRLMQDLQGDYDAILMDSPPLAAGADAFALGIVTGTMLLVLRTGVSDRELAEAKLAVLNQLPVRVLGAILNDVRLGGVYRYYSYHIEGYGAHEEPDPVSWRVLRRPD